MSSSELKGATTIVVDGYNLLLDLAEEALVSEERDRDVARARLADALEEWARLRSCRVVLVWDGSGRLNSSGTAPRERVREIYVAAAEADDFIVEEVRRLREEGRRPGVVTRDRELLGRLPKSVVELGHEQVGADLRALAADPLRAPDILAEDFTEEMPFGEPQDIDTSKLPRRKRPKDEAGPPPAAPTPHRAVSRVARAAKGRAQHSHTERAKPGSGTGTVGGGAPERDAAAERERQAREEAKRKKQARRERFRRAQERKQGTEDKDKDQNNRQDGKARNKKNQSGKKKRGRKK